MNIEKIEKTKVFESLKTTNMAIVGMDALFGSCDGLDAFERGIYQGSQYFTTLPSNRWERIEQQQQLLKAHGFEDGKAPLGAFIKDFEIDTLRIKISPHEAETLNPQQLLILKVADRALQDAEVGEGEKVAVVIASEYLSYVENITVSHISTLWNFTGSAFTLHAGENSAFKALEVAEMLLATKEVDTVVVGAVELAAKQTSKINTGKNTFSYDQNANHWMVGEGAGAVVLKHLDTARQEQKRIYAVINAISFLRESANLEKIKANTVTQVCQKAFVTAEVKPADIDYIEVFGNYAQSEDESEIEGLMRAYQSAGGNLKCAIGNVKANIGHTYTAGGIASLIKTALCLYHRYIPCVPQWIAPKMPDIWQNSPFYVATESKPWFLEQKESNRVAAINGLDLDGTYTHLILSEEPTQKECSSRYLEQMPFYLFPLAANERSLLLNQLNVLQQSIADCSCLSTAASLAFAAFQKNSPAAYAIAIVGRNQEELIREIQRALAGVVDVFDTGKDWQTPVGSYFTSKPLGKKGTIAFVYPGAYSSYIGIARNLFRLFPKLYDNPLIKSVYSRLANVEKILYPRSLNKLSKRQLEALEQRLIDDPVAMLESEMWVAGLLSAILRNYFQLQPDCAFGYSLGETSMMLAQGVWTHFHEGSQSLNSSALFKTELSGAKNAVRRFWKLPQIQDGESSEFWSTHILMCPVSLVQEALKHENHVYLILINTPQEVAIAGDTQACQRVIQRLNCDAFRTPFNYVIHCDAIRSEYDELVKLNTLPIQNIPNTVFYSAANYQPITLDSNSIGQNIAKCLCQQLDFPRLINRVWEDGTRIFIEVGAGSTCSRWISENLKHKEHLAISLNKRGIDEHTSIVRGLAKLVSHQVSLDLSPLYSPVQETFRSSQSMIKSENILDENSKTVPTSNKHQPSTNVPNFINELESVAFHNLKCKNLSANISRIHKAHTHFLQTRQESLRQLGEIIQLQIACSQQLLNQQSLAEINNNSFENKS
ncbi:type I polyketide synthase [Chlorogloeopsis sp. ULAP01]|uniref:type I polyketide synthase n=1 Tax=Chlorogloeopsis sp. ULAP01 TaxID=3056483 RepID=UPI0025AB24B0|nr:type I polyketide synthase [Chlorogloeopsis sp. ULAP01]MDM9383690.1 type I polyketide synthase [Chlorogloeopsis sp. ULAP01]